MNKNTENQNKDDDLNKDVNAETQTHTVTIEKISSQPLSSKKEKIKKIVEDNIFDSVDLKRHKRDKSSIYLAVLAVFVVIGLVIGLLVWSFVN